MTRRAKTTACDGRHAKLRLHEAHAFLDVAEQYGSTPEPEERVVAASNAVLAPIAAADAVCCAILGARSSSDDHAAAVKLFAQVAGAPSKQLERILKVKTNVQYTGGKATQKVFSDACRWAAEVVAFADRQVL